MKFDKFEKDFEEITKGQILAYAKIQPLDAIKKFGQQIFDIKDARGDTIAHYMAYSRIIHPIIWQINIKNNDNKTPLDIIIEDMKYRFRHINADIQYDYEFLKTFIKEKGIKSYVVYDV